jgi:hypothetical protein
MLANGLTLWSAALRSVAAAGYVFANAEAEALVARFTTPATNDRKALIDTMVGALKTASIWSKLDCLYVMAAANAQAAQRNWKADAYNLTPVSSPTFTADRGYQGDNSAAYLGTGFNPTAAAGQYAQDAAAYGVWSLTAAASSGTTQIDMGCTLTGVRADIRIRNSSDFAAVTLNDATAGSAANADGSGLFAALRSGTTRSVRRNKSQILTGSQASTGLPNSEFSILAGGTSTGRSARQLCMAFIGNLNATEADALYDAALPYLQAVGAV